MSCHDCNAPVEEYKGRIGAFCSKCVKKHRSDLVQIITPDVDKIYAHYQANEADLHLSGMPTNIRLDLHGVLDTVDPVIPLGRNVCVISYVGKFSRMRIQAYNEIDSRLKTGQIDFGVLVFKRIRGEIYTDPGSKAWVNKSLSKKSTNRTLFIDDGEDHIKSTLSLNIPNLTCILMQKSDNLVDILNENKTGGGFINGYAKDRYTSIAQKKTDYALTYNLNKTMYKKLMDFN